ncbi:Sister chromatid cohesion protein 2 [Kappamyces sp. JEL0680]|nr:Sister chromatid cohesion protein 2 [Kappamyces sp. JEL0680]
MLIPYLDDPNKQGESYLRSVATDWLGRLSAILRKPHDAVVLRQLDEMGKHNLESLQSKSATPDVVRLVAHKGLCLLQAMRAIPSDPVFLSHSTKFLACALVSQLYQAASAEEISTVVANSVLEFAKAVADDAPGQRYRQMAHGSAGSESIAFLHQFMQHLHPLWQLHDRIVLSIMKGVDADMVPVRTKSIRSLAELLGNHEVGKSLKMKILDAIAKHLSDVSPSVREVSIEAVAKYALGQDDVEILQKYCAMIASRVVDIKVSVRKRVIKTFKDLYTACLSKPIDSLLEDVPRKLLLRLHDEETSVRVNRWRLSVGLDFQDAMRHLSSWRPLSGLGRPVDRIQDRAEPQNGPSCQGAVAERRARLAL